ncbi:MAG: DUF934 domain-containing protein [Nannocystaceae bacterium]|nr:DUF934 domain-containing protein [bacterium]
MALIKNDAVAPPETWTALDSDAAVPAEGNVLVSVERWLNEADALRQRGAQVGILVQPGDDVLTLVGALDGVALVAVAFPKFTEGRGYSSARLLRDRLGYEGELRAVGDVLPDQVFYMRRVGFDSFELAEGKSPQTAIEKLEEFSVTYQAAADTDKPLFRRVQRPS